MDDLPFWSLGSNVLEVEYEWTRPPRTDRLSLSELTKTSASFDATRKQVSGEAILDTLPHCNTKFPVTMGWMDAWQDAHSNVFSPRGSAFAGTLSERIIEKTKTKAKTKTKLFMDRKDNTQLTMLFVSYCCLVTKLYPTLLWPHGLQPTRPLCSWDFPGKNTGVDCHFLLQWATFCQTSLPWPARLGLPHRHGLV